MSTEKIIVIDEGKMLFNIQDFPNQLEKAWTTFWIKDIPFSLNQFKQVIMLGMGGSGIAGKLLVEQFEFEIPVMIWQDYHLPSFVDKNTLVIAVTFSGDTEETLDGLKLAIEKGLTVIAIGSGGRAEELSKIHNFLFLKIDYQSQPRSALGWLYGGLLTLASKLKLISLNEKSYFQALSELRTLVEKKSLFEKAEDMATSFNNKTPVIVASSPLVSVASRWAAQLNENSKSSAFSLSVPELCHNFIASVSNPMPEKFTLVYLDSNYSFSRNKVRRKVIEKIFTQSETSFTPITVRSGSSLAEQLIFIYFGDLVSYYLAGVYGFDPTSIENISYLKNELKKAQ